MKVPIFSLKVEDKKLKKKLLKSVERVLDHGKILLGPEVDLFEKK